TSLIRCKYYYTCATRPCEKSRMPFSALFTYLIKTLYQSDVLIKKYCPRSDGKSLSGNAE
ncbi:hypothetical protein DPA08_26425, partial [Salmonella enterica subsp. enterica serovar Agona]|nr:hypothetical protein [Salmonella enterica subsp. enterica serovar Agona]